MARPKTLKGKIFAYLQKNKMKIIATAFLFVVAFVLMLIPFFASDSGKVEQNQNDTARRIQTAFQNEGVKNIAQAKVVIDQYGFDVSDTENGMSYAWNETSGMVYLRKGSLSFSSALSSFDYLTGDATIGYRADEANCYLLHTPDSVRQDLSNIYSLRYHPGEQISFSSTGVYLDFIRFAYANTLFINQVSDYGFTTYFGDETVGSSCIVAVFGDVNTNELSSAFRDTALSLLKKLLYQTKEVILTRRTEFVEGELFRLCKNLSRFILDDCKAYRLEGNSLVSNESDSLIAYPAKAEELHIVVPDSVKSVEKGAFFGARPVKMTLPFVGYSRGSSLGEFGLFGYCFGRSDEGVEQYVGTGYLTYAIPDTLLEIILTDETKLAKGAFSGMGNLETLQLNEGIVTIENYAFDRCNRLKELILPDSVTSFLITQDNCMNALTLLSMPQNFDIDGFHSFTEKRTEGNRVVYTR